MVRLEKKVGAAVRMDFQDQQETEGVRLEGRQELPSGWSIKGRRMLRLQWPAGHVSAVSKA